MLSGHMTAKTTSFGTLIMNKNEKKYSKRSVQIAQINLVEKT